MLGSEDPVGRAEVGPAEGELVEFATVAVAARTLLGEVDGVSSPPSGVGDEMKEWDSEGLGEGWGDSVDVSEGDADPELDEEDPMLLVYGHMMVGKAEGLTELVENLVVGMLVLLVDGLLEPDTQALSVAKRVDGRAVTVLLAKPVVGRAVGLLLANLVVGRPLLLCVTVVLRVRR